MLQVISLEDASGNERAVEAFLWYNRGLQYSFNFTQRYVRLMRILQKVLEKSWVTLKNKGSLLV